MTWSPERVEMLKRLWTEGLTASQIAAQLGQVSRNSVIGKVHRLNLTGRAKPASAPKPVRRARPPAPRVTANRPPSHAQPPRPYISRDVPFEDMMVPLSFNISLEKLENGMCKWPIGDPQAENFCYCGHKQYNTLPYCEYHSRIAYQPVQRRVDRRNFDRGY